MGAKDQVKLEALRKEEAALQCKMRGLTFDEMAVELGCAKTTAYDAYRRAVAKRAEERARLADEVIENHRLETELAKGKLWPAVMEGNVRAIETMIKLQQREAALLGLDAPKRLRVQTEDVNRIISELTKAKAYEHLRRLQADEDPWEVYSDFKSGQEGKE